MIGTTKVFLSLTKVSQISLILPDVHVVKLGRLASLLLDLLGHLSAGIDPVALEGAEDGIEAALFYLVPAFQALNHVPVCMRVFEVHIERGRISDTRLGKTSLTTPEFHAALEVRVEDPHAFPLPQSPWMEPASPEVDML